MPNGSELDAGAEGPVGSRLDARAECPTGLSSKRETVPRRDQRKERQSVTQGPGSMRRERSLISSWIKC